jgi:uncharacterized protein YxjI
MHTGQYLKAADIFQSVVELSSFRLLSDVKKERWRIFQAYLHYIYKSQKIKEIRPAIQNAKTNFRINDFLTEKPVFAKEKRGLNIAALTVQIMFFLEKFETDKLNECVSAIEKYCRRYPKKDINFRSECFIEMLVNMSKEDFRFYQTRKDSEKIYEEMISVHMEYHGGNRALEVMPYEVMWNIILDRLKTYKYG